MIEEVISSREEACSVAPWERGLGGLGDLLGAGGDLVDRGAHLGEDVVDRFHGGVERALEDVKVALVAPRHHRGEVALGQVLHDLRGLVDRADHEVEGLVDALDDLAVVPLVLVRVRPGLELAFLGGPGEHEGVGHEAVHGLDADVEVGLDHIEVAVVGVGDLGRDRSLGDLVHIGCGHVEGADHGVEGLVDTLDDLAVVPLVLRRVRPGREAALDGGLGEDPCVRHEVVDRVDADIEIVLDHIEVAVVGVRDLGWDRSFGDLVHIGRGDVEGGRSRRRGSG